MLADITVQAIDSVNVRVLCERPLARQLDGYFSFEPPNAYHIRRQSGFAWDGRIRLFRVGSQLLNVGLLPYLLVFANDNGKTIEFEPEVKKWVAVDPSVTPERILEYMTQELTFQKGGSVITPRPHQCTGTYIALHHRRAVLIAPTGSGKSLIIYSILRYLVKYGIEPGRRILVVVPNVGLLAQLLDDFADYSGRTEDYWGDPKWYNVYQGKNRDVRDNCPVVIGTWQTLYKQPKNFFDQFYAVLGDEAHTFKAKCLGTIMKNLRDCPYRLGFTGTLNDAKVHKLILEGLFGMAQQIVSTKNLMDSDLLSALHIQTYMLGYPQDLCRKVSRMTYQEEIEFLVDHGPRNDFLTQISIEQEGNTLVLFQRVDKHGLPLYNRIVEKTDRPVYFMAGSVKKQEREEIRQKMIESDNAILVASFGTCSTGINIPNLSNVIFASPVKSKIRVLQSVGRGLRKSANKVKTKLFDVADNLCSNGKQNYTYRHAMARREIYDSEGFSYDDVDLQLGVNDGQA